MAETIIGDLRAKWENTDLCRPCFDGEHGKCVGAALQWGGPGVIKCSCKEGHAIPQWNHDAQKRERKLLAADQCPTLDEKLRLYADVILRQVVCCCGNYRHHGVDWMPEGSGEGLSVTVEILRRLVEAERG